MRHDASLSASGSLASVIGAERESIGACPGPLVGLVGSTIIVAAFSLHATASRCSGGSLTARRDSACSTSRGRRSRRSRRSRASSPCDRQPVRRDHARLRGQGRLTRWTWAGLVVGSGAGSIAAGLIGAFPVDASPAAHSRDRLGLGRTQDAGLRRGGGGDRADPGGRTFLKGRGRGDDWRRVLIYVATRIFRLPRPARDRPLQ